VLIIATLSLTPRGKRRLYSPGSEFDIGSKETSANSSFDL
jgi:hypothetical protein